MPLRTEGQWVPPIQNYHPEFSGKYCHDCNQIIEDMIKGYRFNFPGMPRFKYVGASLRKGQVMKHYRCNCGAEFQMIRGHYATS